MPIQTELDSEVQETRPLISIVIPSLEADVELRRCVDSVRIACRSGAGSEIIVVVPRHQVEAVRALVQGVIVVTESRPSIYGAMNDGVAASSGRYLYFIGKDDILLPPFGDMLRILVDHEPSAVFCDVYWGARGTYSGRPSRWRVLVRNFCHQGIVYSREALNRHGPYIRRMRVQADHLLNVRLLWDRELAKSIRYFAFPLAWYSGAGFSTMARDPVFWRLYPTVMRRYVGAWAAFVLLVSRKLRGR